MAVSGLKCSFTIISKCRPRTVFVNIHPPLSTRQQLSKCFNLRIDVGLHSRTFSSCSTSNNRRYESIFLCSNKPELRPICTGIKPLYHNPILYENSQPRASVCNSQARFFRSYSTEEEPEKKPSLFQRFKSMYRDYWYVLVPVHAVTSLAWFGGFYYLLTSGVDVVAIIDSYQILSEKIITPLRDSSAGYLALSYAMYKIFTPLRYTVTLGGTTVAINYLKKWGYIKPMPSREKLQEMYQERRDNLKEKRDNILSSVRGTKDGIREQKENIIKTVQEKSKDLKVQPDIVKEKHAKSPHEERK